MGERLYKGKFSICVYNVDPESKDELELIAIENNIKGLMAFFEIKDSDKEQHRITMVVNRSLRKKKSNDKGIIVIKNEQFKIHLMKERKN